MKYMGSKRRIAKHIFPIMDFFAKDRGVSTWVEPFVGGGNMIDYVSSAYTRVGYDVNPHVIQALTDIRDFAEYLPDSVSEAEYSAMKGRPPEIFTSWVRFVCSFGGKFEAGYARQKGADANVESSAGKRNALAQQARLRNYAAESYRDGQKQSPKIQNVQFICDSYENLDFENCLVYCDPPYQNTSGYKTGDLDHEAFFNWCRIQAKKNLVFVSEYAAPDDFVVVWEGDIKTNFSSTRTSATHTARERLFLVIDSAVNTK